MSDRRHCYLCTIGQGPATIVRYDLLLLRQRGSYAGVFFYTILSLKIERINIKYEKECVKEGEKE